MIWGDMLFWPVIGAFVLLKIVLALVFLVFIIWMIVDCIQRNFRVSSEKIVWLALLILISVVDVFGGMIVAVVYYILIRALNPGGVSKHDNQRKRRS